MKVTGYKIWDSTATLGAIGTHFVGGDLVVGGTASLTKNWSNIRKGDLRTVQLQAAVVADVAWTQTFTPAGTIAAGDVFTLTVSRPDSRQRQNRVYKHVAKAGAVTAELICDAFRALINGDDSSLITASGTTTLILTADTAGLGYSHLAVSGASGAATFTGGAATADEVATTAAALAAKFEGVDAADFGSAVLFYDAYVIDYRVDSNVGHGISQIPQKAIVFTESTVVGTTLDDAIAGNYAFAVDGLGVDGNIAV